jgi:hypothetical protein
MHWYVDRVLRLTTKSQWARQRFLEVQGMLRDASAILKPDMLVRVLFDIVRSRVVRELAGAHGRQESFNGRDIVRHPDSRHESIPDITPPPEADHVSDLYSG